jgi:hypothetical protein
MFDNASNPFDRSFDATVGLRCRYSFHHTYPHKNEVLWVPRYKLPSMLIGPGTNTHTSNAFPRHETLEQCCRSTNHAHEPVVPVLVQRLYHI